MRNPLYLAQLKRDLERWIAEGLVEARHREAILASAGEIRLAASLPAVLLTLGVILIGFFAMSFVAANWQELGKLAKLILLFGAMAFAYLAAHTLMVRGRTAFGQAFILLGVALFGVNIMLIAQIYHIRAHDPDGMLMWVAGALLAAFLVPSRPALAASLVIATFWTWAETFDFNVAIHWPYLVFLGVAAIVAHAYRWNVGFHLVFLSLVYWLALNTEGIADTLGFEATDMIGFFVLLWLAIWANARQLKERGFAFGHALAHYSVLLLAIAVFCLQFAERPAGAGLVLAINGSLSGLALLSLAAGALTRALSRLDALAGLFTAVVALALPFAVPAEAETSLAFGWLMGALVIAFFVWMVASGAKIDDRFLVNWGFVGFGAEALYLYTATFDTLLDSALFFLVGGALLIALGFGLERLRRRALARGDAGGER